MGNRVWLKRYKLLFVRCIRFQDLVLNMVTIINTDKPISERSKKLGDEANCSFCLCSLKTTLTFEVSLLGVREGDKKIKPCDPSPGL